MEYLKKDSENVFEYLMRLVSIKLEDKPDDLSWADIVTYCGLDCHYDSLRKAMQPAEYGGYAVYKHLKEQNVAKVSSQDFMDELTLKKYELQKERVKLQTDKLEVNRWIRETAREEMFLEQIVKAIQSTETDPNPIRKIEIKHNKRQGVLCFADCHFGKEYKIYGLNNEIMNEYSPEIFYSRMEQLFNETIEYIAKENLTILDVMSLGDTLDGFLRNSQLWTLRYGVVDSAIIYGKYIASWLKKLSNYVYIRYHQTSGNHCELRLLDGKKGEHANENIEKVVLEIIEIKNEDNPNFEIIQNKTGLIYTNIAGFNILGIHGEVKDLAQAIKDFSDVYDAKIHYIVAGHKHHATFINCGVKRGAIGITSVVGSDDFSIKLLRQADAGANFIIFEEEKGKVAEYNIILN